VTNTRDDLAALRGRIEHRIEDALVVCKDANTELSELRMELADLPIPGTRLYASGSLTTREMEVLDRMTRGWSTQRMAKELFIAQATTRNHVQSIMNKLHAHTRLDAVMNAQKAGLI
jgi:DNA-binding NarL/FixJ family response regulator